MENHDCHDLASGRVGRCRRSVQRRVPCECITSRKGDKRVRQAERQAQRGEEQLAYAAATRWIKLSCSLLLSAPMVNASSRFSDSAYLIASLCLLRRSPCPRIFIPISPLPDDFISRITLTTGAGSSSICEPMGLMRTRSTSTHGDLAAARSASMVWHEQPCARMMPLSFASDNTSIVPLKRSVQSPSVMQ